MDAMTARPDDLLRRADVVAWLRERGDSLITPEDPGWTESGALESAADRLEAGAVPAAPPGVSVELALAIAAAREMACGIADSLQDQRIYRCPVCEASDAVRGGHREGCIVPGWAHRRADGSLR
jgi:hypothetical protein